MTNTRIHLASLGAAAVLGALALVPVTPAHADPTTMAECTSAGNVWVVVQAPAEFNNGTALDKQGCATAPTSGTDALKQIGADLSTANSLISQIDGVPTEVPATFDGNYWNYWTTTPVEGSTTQVNPWTFSVTGADDSKPAAGSVEGWYYNNPGTDTMVAALPTEFSATAPSNEASQAPDKTEEPAKSSGMIGWVIAAAVVVVAVLGFAGFRRSRSGTQQAS